MKGIVLAVGVGLASLALSDSASAQAHCATAPVAGQPTCTTYWHSSWPQPVTPCYQPIPVSYPTYTPACWAPTYRYVSCRPYSCWTPSYPCHHRVIHWSRWCR